MKSAQEFFDDFVRNARILSGSAVVLREDKPKGEGDPNWIASVRETSDDALYQKHVSDMRKRHPTIDWSDVKERDSNWRVIKAIKKA